METMHELSVTHATFNIERGFPVTVERVFTAFADPTKKRRWFREDEMNLEEFVMDFQVGGKERSRFRLTSGPYEGIICTNDTTYQDIVTNSRIILAYTMTLGDRRISASLSTFEFRPAEKGTVLVFTEQAAFFEGSDGAKMRQEGWIELIGKLAAELAL